MNAQEKVKLYLDNIKKRNGKINAVLHINENALQEAKEIDAKKKKGRLYGYVFGIKSNINVKGLIANCASKVLEDYISTYDASVIEKIKKEDGIIIGMLNCDEFAAGGSGENSAFGATDNPACPGRVAGGSSSGSAAAVAADFCDVALGSDTGGSIRTPASHCGIVGVKPSYGRVSRYGLIDLSMSLDQIGPLSKKVSDSALVLDVISGKDERDTTTFESSDIKLSRINKAKVGVLKIKGVDGRIQELIDKKTQTLEKKYGWEVKTIEVEYIDLAVATYYILVYSEFFSTTRRLDGRRYGKKIEEACGKEVLRRILGGSEITKAELAGQYYKKALEIKELIREEFDKVFDNVDCIMLPTVPGLPWKLGTGAKMKTEEIYAYDALTIPANLAQICALSMPAGKVTEAKEEIPVGIQIFCKKGEDSKLLSLAKMIEEI